MKQSNNLGPFKVSSILLGILVFFIPLSVFILKKATKKELEILVLSHNASGINNNPLEYRNQLAILSKSEDASLRDSAAKLLQVDDHMASKLKERKVGVLFDKPNIRAVISAVCKSMQFKNIDIGRFINDFLKKNATLSLEAYFAKTIDDFRYFDKMLRVQDALIPCPTFPYKEDFAKDMQAFLIQATGGINKKKDLKAYFTKPWINAIKHYLPAFYEKSNLSQEAFIKAVIGYYLFHRNIFTQLYLDGAMEEWLYVALHFYDIADTKDAVLAKAYKEKKPVFISLQEATKNVVNQVCQNDYIIAEEDKAAIEGAGSFGSINLYKASFIKNNGYVISKLILQRFEVEKYGQQENLSAKDLNKLFSNEVNINRLENNRHIILHASFHADSRGDNTKLFLQAFFDLFDEIKQSSKKPVYVIICMDGNFTKKSTPGKRDLDSVRDIIEDAGCKIVMQKGENVSTTKKMRSFLQVQQQKSHALAEEESDVIIVSNSISVLDAYLGDYTTLSDHREVVAKLVK